MKPFSDFSPANWADYFNGANMTGVLASTDTLLTIDGLASIMREVKHLVDINALAEIVAVERRNDSSPQVVALDTLTWDEPDAW